jgi:hypothetical protein
MYLNRSEPHQDHKHFRLNIHSFIYVGFCCGRSTLFCYYVVTFPSFSFNHPLRFGKHHYYTTITSFKIALDESISGLEKAKLHVLLLRLSLIRLCKCIDD